MSFAAKVKSVFGQPHPGKHTHHEIMKATFRVGDLAEEGQELHWIMRDGEPWFFADVACRALGLIHVSRCIESLDADEKGMCSAHTLGGSQQKLVVSESGLYDLIARSRRPEAKKFWKWVRSEILPSIRKTGSYTIPGSQEQPSAKALTHQEILREGMRDVHRREKDRILETGVGVSGLGKFYNQVWHALDFSGGSKQAKAALGFNSGSPWDHTSDLVLAMNWYSKALMERVVVDQKAIGVNMPFQEQCDIACMLTKQVYSIASSALNGKLDVRPDANGKPSLDIVPDPQICAE
jgi:prophage antirepressor-like protein